jgi:sarcosine oxidase
VAGQGSRLKVAVVGAGAFGGWTALALRRRGAEVTLLDAWGPANPRASSHGESRLIRALYGPDRRLSALAARALVLWEENEARFGRRLYRRTGALWMTEGDDAYVRAALPLLAAAGIRYDEPTVEETARRYPQMNLEGVTRVVFEPEAGFLLAGEACRTVVEAFVLAGGTYRHAEARPLTQGVAATPAPLPGLELADGSTLAADHYVLAAGPWLGDLLPALLGRRILPTRQEVFVFGPPPGDARFTDAALPVWVDMGERIVYGVPAGGGRGFKIADDTRGAPFHPTTGDRTPGAEGIDRARRFMARRFPGMAAAPLLEATVCQYENAPAGQFIIDRHPAIPNLCIVGGGSGHGFKHGPAVGELAAGLVLGENDGWPPSGGWDAAGEPGDAIPAAGLFADGRNR